MNEIEAVEYLEEKNELINPFLKRKTRRFGKEEKEKIAKVMKEGKVFGDPLAIIQ